MILELLREYMEEDGIRVYIEASVSEVKRDSRERIVSTSIGGKIIKIKAQHILVATSRVPNTENLCLENTGVSKQMRRVS